MGIRRRTNLQKKLFSGNRAFKVPAVALGGVLTVAKQKIQSSGRIMSADEIEAQGCLPSDALLSHPPALLGLTDTCPASFRGLLGEFRV